MIRLSLVGVRVEVPSNQPIVLLREEAPGRRYLPIFIGQPEATAIVYALQGMESPRPMTHDLFKNVLEELTARIDRIVITELKDGTFYATRSPSRSSPPTPCSKRRASSSRATTKKSRWSSSGSSSSGSVRRTSLPEPGARRLIRGAVHREVHKVIHTLR